MVDTKSLKALITDIFIAHSSGFISIFFESFNHILSGVDEKGRGVGEDFAPNWEIVSSLPGKSSTADIFW